MFAILLREHPELVRMIILEISDPRDLGHILLTCKLPFLSCDDRAQLKNKFISHHVELDVDVYIGSYFLKGNPTCFDMSFGMFFIKGIVSCLMLNGARHGPFQMFYKNGTKAIETTYKQGLLEGPFFVWHDNGKKAFFQEFEKGLCHGAFKHYDSEGNRVCHCSFHRGELHGIHRTWYGDGKMPYISRYNHGLKVDYLARDLTEDFCALI